MTDAILITADHINKVKPLAPALDFAKYCHPVIREVQDMDIRKALGNVFYYDLLANATSNNDYVKLLDGEDYTNEQGYTVSFRGLRHCIAVYFWSRYILTLNTHAKSGSYASNLSDHTQHVSDKKILEQSAQYKENGKQYLMDCLEYIYIKRDTLTKWQQGEGKRMPNSSVKYITI